MKKIILFLVCVFTLTNIALADNDRPVRFDRLPSKAQSFIRNHFRHSDIVKIEREDGGFEVLMRNGVEIDFGRNGRWKEIQGKRHGVPASVIPAHIKRQVAKRYGRNVRVVEISREKDKVEVELSNGQEFEYNSRDCFDGYDD